MNEKGFFGRMRDSFKKKLVLEACKMLVDGKDAKNEDVGFVKEEFFDDWGLKQVSFYCADNRMYVARFVSDDGSSFEFKMSKTKVWEHIEKTGRDIERYILDNRLVVAHFHKMAKRWYCMTRIPVNV